MTPDEAAEKAFLERYPRVPARRYWFDVFEGHEREFLAGYAAGRASMEQEAAASEARYREVVEAATVVANCLVERETLDWRPDRRPIRTEAMALAVAVDALAALDPPAKGMND